MKTASGAEPIRVGRAGGLSGKPSIPGDKSISHRALILGASAIGETRIEGLLEGEDVLASVEAMRALGADITRDDKGVWHVSGLGPAGFLEPEDVIDCGNSGTLARLIMGAIAPCPIRAVITGDASLRSRPMKRVTEPLGLMGAQFECREGGRLPITIKGAALPIPLEYRSPIASAQIKSAVLLAGLGARGDTKFHEPRLSRDHSERMLAGFGAQIQSRAVDDGHEILLTGLPELRAQEITIPADPSSAAFPIAAALITEGSAITLKNIGLNPTRTGLITTLQEMGANIEIGNERISGGEPTGDITARFSPNLKPACPPPERAPSMIDEYPILAALAAFAKGESVMQGIAELRVKESDRISLMVNGLRACGVEIEEGKDEMRVKGAGMKPLPGGARIETSLDHRIAMSFYVLGLNAKEPITIDDSRPIKTSFPNFLPMMEELGARHQFVNEAGAKTGK